MKPIDDSKWYNSIPTVVVLLLLFFPVGLFVLWRSQKIHVFVKTAVTGLFLFLFIYSMTLKMNQSNQFQDRLDNGPRPIMFGEEDFVVGNLTKEEYKKHQDAYMNGFVLDFTMFKKKNTLLRIPVKGQESYEFEDVSSSDFRNEIVTYKFMGYVANRLYYVIGQHPHADTTTYLLEARTYKVYEGYSLPAMSPDLQKFCAYSENYDRPGKAYLHYHVEEGKNYTEKATLSFEYYGDLKQVIWISNNEFACHFYNKYAQPENADTYLKFTAKK